MIAVTKKTHIRGCVTVSIRAIYLACAGAPHPDRHFRAYLNGHRYGFQPVTITVPAPNRAVH